MGKLELIKGVLEKMGRNVDIDKDGDLHIVYQMKHFYVIIGDEDEPYVCVILPQFHEIEDGKGTVALAACNSLTRELKMVKVYVDQSFENITASCEFYYSDEKSLEMSLSETFRLMGVVRTVFRKKMHELSSFLKE